MRSYIGKTYQTLDQLKDQMESDGYDILYESYSTLDIIDINESDGIISIVTFYKGDYGVRVDNIKEDI